MKRFLFLHPTKTGGSSVLKTLSKVLHINKSHLPLNKSTLDKKRVDPSTLIFSTCRNPYSRVLSMYNYFHYLHKLQFFDFLKILETHQNDTLYMPQHRYIKNGNFYVDKIIKLESFETDFADVLNCLGVETKIEKDNITLKKIKKTLTEPEKNIIYSLYQEDFEILNYDK